MSGICDWEWRKHRRGASGVAEAVAFPRMTLGEALKRPLLFFGGKGGVGKTTLATARALESAAEGSRTLLVSTDPAHSTGDALGLVLGPDAREVARNLWAMELDPAEEAERYLAAVHDRLKDATPPRLSGEVARQLDVARASPGAEEAALFDRFTRIIEEPGFQRIIFDTAPSGQTLRLLSMPELMTSWIGTLISQRRKVNSLGRMWRNAAGRAAGSAGVDRDVVLAALEERQERFERTRLVLQDRGRTAFVFVTVAERLPDARDTSGRRRAVPARHSGWRIDRKPTPPGEDRGSVSVAAEGERVRHSVRHPGTLPGLAPRLPPAARAGSRSGR